MKKYVYLFDETKASDETVILLGNKGAQLAEMTSIGLPVPPGFTITTEACNEFYKNDKNWPGNLKEQVQEQLAKVEKKMGKKFGDSENPLLFSVRSGSYVSMPGMMDTVLNLGLNDQTVKGLAKQSGNERGAYDSYRRFLQMFGDVVLGVEHSKFEGALSTLKETRGVEFDTDLSADDLKELIETYKEIIKKETGDFPNSPEEQLELSINAVFESWNTDRAVSYRRINSLRSDAGTGVNVQVMVFGNFGNDCGTGVGFTRNPATGKKEHYGEYLINAQGEDVVAGLRTPQPIDTLKKVMPEAYEELVKIYDKLEKHYKDMQDFEFTIEKEKLYMLQTRKGKRTAPAALKIAVDMFNEGLIDKKTAVMRIDPNSLNQLLHKRLDTIAKEKMIEEGALLAKGLPASPGAAVGTVVFTAEKAVELAEKGDKVVLVRMETSPEDIEGMHVAQGILTARGGMTSHAAVVARGMGTCCVAGCADISVNEEEGFFKAGGITIKEGEYITLDGSTGEVMKGQIPTVEPDISGDFGKLMSWADEFRKLSVKTNADTPKDAQKAKDFGAEGIGLCRTEHMFFEGDRIKAVREMILAKTEEGRHKALAKLEPYQQEDFEGLFRVMDGLPVIIRLLDPPLHEFLPKEAEDIEALSKEMEISVQEIKDLIEDLHEFNPMLGFRGCRLGVQYPEINAMQTRAILKAAIKVKGEGKNPMPWIEIPLVGHVKEVELIKGIIEKEAEMLGAKGKIKYKIGTMIEVPRAAITADEIADKVEFMSFGTNDLTQMGCGFSRDDSGKFLKKYVEYGIYEKDPFQSIDQEGIGKLMKICIEHSRKKNPKIHIGICGEHGGEPESVKFCHKSGLNEVSCSPFRVPIARLAAAQAAIEDKK
ncbi:MAG: pyruvate, phosphate dikinase [Candidatus Aenigmarchaeota archaeon]|nr:pyruvate, phosphate dikinase [Candidatus Aenigmarchaeota archaeon]